MKQGFKIKCLEFTVTRVWTSEWGFNRETIVKIGQEVSGGLVLVHGLAVRVRHAMVRGCGNIMLCAGVP